VTALNELPPAASGPAFREAMSRIASHVTIVATSGPGGLGGVTVTAVTPVSDAPPSILICLNADSRTLEKIRRNGVFCVSALAAQHEAVAQVFSGGGGLDGPQRFRTGDGWIMEGRSPRLRDALAAVECAVADITPVGTHVVLIGRVETAHEGPDLPPLMYHRRRYWGA
jgi:flavin reductase